MPLFVKNIPSENNTLWKIGFESTNSGAGEPFLPLDCMDKACVNQKCTSKGRGRQSIVLKHRICLQKEPMPCRPMPLLVQLRVEGVLLLRHR